MALAASTGQENLIPGQLESELQELEAKFKTEGEDEEETLSTEADSDWTGNTDEDDVLAALGEDDDDSDGVGAAPPIDPAEYAKLTHKLSVLEGKYRAEGARNREDIEAGRIEVQNLREQLNRDHSTTSSTTLPQGIHDVLTEEQKALGDDLWDGVGRAAQHVAESSLADIRAQLNELRKDNKKSVEQSFYERLDGAVQDWRAINHSPEWKTWLAAYDVPSGMTRQQMLDDSAARGQAPRAAYLFEQFRSDQKSAGVARPTSLASQVIPGQAAGAPMGAVASPRNYTWQEYEKQMDVAQRLVSSDPSNEVNVEKSDKIVRRLERAMGEGRIRPPDVAL